MLCLCTCFFVFYFGVQMSPFKTSAMKGGNDKGKEPVIDVDDPSPRSKMTQSSTGMYEPNKFRSCAAFQTY